MSVYVGIDVHRKRSQVAVINQVGEVLANRNVPNGVKPILGVIGDLPAGTPAAFEAAFGWGWLVQLLEDYGFDPHLVHFSGLRRSFPGPQPACRRGYRWWLLVRITGMPRWVVCWVFCA
jgi:hypothetical protein